MDDSVCNAVSWAGLTVGAARGKLIILPDGYTLPSGRGIAYNQANIQDDCESPHAGEKMARVFGQFSRSIQNPQDGIMWINYASAHIWNLGPKHYSDVLNPWLIQG